MRTLLLPFLFLAQFAHAAFQCVQPQAGTMSLPGFSSGPNSACSASDTIQTCLQKLQSQISNFSGGGGGSAWGSITGALSSQTDLQTALNAKAGISAPSLTGAVSIAGNTGDNCPNPSYGCTSIAANRLEIGTSAQKFTFVQNDGYLNTNGKLDIFVNGIRRFSLTGDVGSGYGYVASGNSTNVGFSNYNGYGLLSKDGIGVAYWHNSFGFFPFSGSTFDLGLANNPWRRTYTDALITKRETSGDTNSTISTNIKFHAVTALTAARIKTLPSLSGVPNGLELVVVDESGAANTYNITISAGAGDYIGSGAATSTTITANNGVARFYAVTTTTPKRWFQW